MKKSFIIILFLAIVQLAKAQTSTLEQADSAYTADNYAQAAELYLKVINEEGTSSKILYNLGNSYFKLGEMGNAILAYERALRLDPSDKDIKNNLEFVNARITDRPGERGTFVENALDAFSASMMSNTWAWIAFACFVLTLAGILAYLFVNSIAVRKLGFFGGIVTFIVMCCAIFFAFRSEAICMADNVAIITSPSTILSTAPRAPQDRNQEAMLLHEGTKVTILDSVSSTVDSVRSVWYDVQIDNAHRAWINGRDIEKI